MAIEFVGGATAGKAGATSGNTTIALDSGLSGGIASSVAAGDLVIAVFGTGATADRTLAITDGSSAYTLIASELYQDDTFDTNLRVAYKVMGGSPDTDTTFGPTGNTADAGAMAVYVFRGVDPTTPLDVAAVTGQAANTSRVVPPDILPTTAGAYVVVAGAAAHNGGTDTFTSGDLTGFLTVGGTNDTNDVTIGIGHDAWASGTTNFATWGHTQADSTSFSWAAITFALRPAAGAVDQAMDVTDVNAAVSLLRQISLNKSATKGNSVTSVKQLGRIRTLSQAATASLATAKAFTRDLVASIAATASVARLVSLSKAISVATTATRQRLVSLTRAVSVAKAVTRTNLVHLTKFAAISANAAFMRHISLSKAIAEAISAGVTQSKSYARVLAATQAVVATLDQNKAYVRVLAASVATAVTRSRAISFIRNLVVSEQISRIRSIHMSRSINLTATIVYYGRTIELIRSTTVSVETSLLRAFDLTRSVVSGIVSALGVVFAPPAEPIDMVLSTIVSVSSTLGRLAERFGFYFGKRGFRIEARSTEWTAEARGTEWNAGGEAPTKQDSD